MIEKQTPYKQHDQMGMQMMPPLPMQKSRLWMPSVNLFPQWLSQYAVIVYIIALAVVTVMYFSYSLPWYYMLSGLVSVLVFFLYGRKVAQETSIVKIQKGKNFEKRIFLIAFIPRLIYVFLLYWIFQVNYGDALGFENSDAFAYDELGQFVAGLFEKGDFRLYSQISKYTGNNEVSDMGYGVYVGFIYWMTDNSIIAVRILKCIWSALTVILIYRLAKRNFGEQTARMAAIFVALWPNFWYYCTTLLKETEMVFLTVLFVEQADQMLRSRQFSLWKIIFILLIAATIFTFRTPLGMVALLALMSAIVMSSTKVIGWGKRIIMGVLAVLLIGVIAGNRLSEKAQELMEKQETLQKMGIEKKATRKDASGNKQIFARYAGTAVFAPMIFTLPFPSMVRPFEGQNQQQLQNGGNFVKNIISFFTIFAMIFLFLSGRWKEHILPISFVIGYLMVLALSSFAHSERFHQPVMPFEFMFAAYGLSIAVTKPKYKRWFTYWSFLVFIAAIAWNWFKLAGRGLW